MNLEQVIVALDDTDPEKNYAMIDSLAGHVSRVKIGSICFSAEGPKIIEYANKKDLSVFLDLKYHDIPNTVAKAVQSICSCVEIEFLTIHALGGSEMIRAVRESVDDLPVRGDRRPKILSVTMLTSHDQDVLTEIGLVNQDMKEVVLSLGKLSKNAGSDGIVCSPHEVAQVREVLGDDFVYMVPGIRLPQDQAQDQKRIATPDQAVRDGASYVVMGRSITQVDDPLDVLQAIAKR